MAQRCLSAASRHLPRARPARGQITESQAQELIDDLVIKFRIIRFLRTPEYNQLFSGDPTWVTEFIGGIGKDGRSLVTKTSFRVLNTLYNLGPAPEPNLTVGWSPRLTEGFKRFAAKCSIDTSSIQYMSDDLMRPKYGDDAAIACCVSGMRVGKQMQFFGARVNMLKTLLYAINGGRDEMTGEQIGPKLQTIAGNVATYDEVLERFGTMMEWLAKTYVNALNIIRYMHDKYCYEAVETKPITQRQLRQAARMRASHVAEVLAQLIAHGRVNRCADGYRLNP
jgi:formate C-acetyltransferase